MPMDDGAIVGVAAPNADVSNPHSAAIIPRCHIPWQQMVIDSTGYAAPCCYWGAIDNKNDAIGNINEQSIEEIWNGPGYQKLREGMASGDLVKAGCANCYAIKQGMGLAFEYDPDCEREAPGQDTTPYAQNIAILKAEIATGATVLEAKPTIVSFTPSHRCNIRCTHCYQESTRSAELGRARADNEVTDLAPYLVRLVAGGGEPFLLPIWRKFLANYNMNSNPYLVFSTSTNATLITDAVLDGLKRFKRLTLNVSLDGTGEAFERVRVGANFIKVRDNIRKLQVAAANAPHPESAVGVSMCVMKSNITDLPNFIRYVTEEKLSFGLSPVATMPPDESLRCFNDITIETNGWLEALIEAERLVQDLYLPTMVADRGEDHVQEIERAFWRNNFAALRATIPDVGDVENYRRVKVKLPQYMLDYMAVNKTDTKPVVYIYSYDMPDSAPLYWAGIENGFMEVTLPPGVYSLNVWNKWAVAGYWEMVRFCVGKTNPDVIDADYFLDTQADRLRWKRRVHFAKLNFRPVTVELPAALFDKIPSLRDGKANAVVYVLGQPRGEPVARGAIENGQFQTELPPGNYCVTADHDFVNPGYWDVVRFAVGADHGENDEQQANVIATYHRFTRQRVLDRIKRIISPSHDLPKHAL
jgi:radical SAM protein with 4Fe4S-binding SPASM domain